MFDQEAFDGWLKTRPECVRRLAAEFPPNSVIRWSGGDLFLIGWNESDQLIVSPVDPAVDFDGALAAKTYLCASHLRDNVVEVLDRER